MILCPPKAKLKERITSEWQRKALSEVSKLQIEGWTSLFRNVELSKFAQFPPVADAV